VKFRERKLRIGVEEHFTGSFQRRTRAEHANIALEQRRRTL